MEKSIKKRELGEIYEGEITISAKAYGYVYTSDDMEDIEIEPLKLNTALPDDVVKVKVTSLASTTTPANARDKDNRDKGEVVEIISRHQTQFVGVIEKAEKDGKKVLYLVPDNKRMYRDILITPESAAPFPNLEDNTKVYVEMLPWTDTTKNIEGKILRVLGKKGVHDVEMQSIVLEQGFDTKFPAEVEKEAERAAKAAEENFEKELANRKDFRKTLTFTIDPFDAKDFDDAISLKELPDGNLEIGVHIADVSHFVTEGSALDKEARSRGFSVYLVDRTIPMLPEVLSNDMCSLNPNEDKFSFSAVFNITKEGKITDRWFGKTVIHSDKRFTYENAQEAINTESAEYHSELTTLNKLAKILQKERFDNGAIDFETEEIKFRLDENGVPVEVYKKARLDTHKLVEEYMLLANREVAEFIFKKHKDSKAAEAFLYRIHDLPDQEKIGDLTTFIRALGFDLKSKEGKVTSKEIRAMLKSIEGSSSEGLIKTATIRSMAKAIYSVQNIGHFGLGFEYYTHFTSPIRRYADLIVHRILFRELTSGKVPEGEFAKYSRIAADTTEKEISAAEAERGSIKYKQVEYMSSRIGQTFNGTISGVSEWGIYVEEENSKSEGMVKLRDIKDDVYSLDKKNYAVVGARTKRTFSLGDKIKFKVMNADMERKTLDYSLV